MSLNEPTPALVDSLERNVAGVRILSSPVNRGFGGACNWGCAEARGEMVVLLNDDVVVCDGWLAALVDAADEHDQAGAVGSRILLNDGRVQEEGAVIWSDGSTTLIGYQNEIPTSSDLQPRRVDYCSAASFLVKRATWEILGGIDTDYFPAYYEDVDFCMRIRAIGQTIFYQPRSTVVHRESSSTTRPYRTYLARANQQRFAARWAPALSLQEAPDPGNPDAVIKAAKLAETRPVPIPGPLPLGGDPRRQLGTNDRDYLKRQLGILEGYATTLEEEVAEGAVSRAAMESELAHVRDELNSARRAIEHLSTQIASLSQRDAEREAEFAGLAGRWRYQMVDRWYGRATKLPGMRRALNGAGRRHHEQRDAHHEEPVGGEA